MVLFFVVALSIILAMQGILPDWLIPFIYPLSVAGVPLTIVSIGMTWQGFSGRKVASFGVALFLPGLLVFFTLFDPSLFIATIAGRNLLNLPDLIRAPTTGISRAPP